MHYFLLDVFNIIQKQINSIGITIIINLLYLVKYVNN